MQKAATRDITIGSDQEFLLVAQDAAVPENVPSSITILRQPLSHIYLVASAAMDYFDRLDAVDRIALSGLKACDWYIESAKAAMEDGSMRLRREVFRAGLRGDSGEQAATSPLKTP